MINDLSELVYFVGNVRGTVAKSKRGSLKGFSWSDLFLVFIPEKEKKTLAQMSENEYYSWKERSSAESYEEGFAKFFLNRAL